MVMGYGINALAHMIHLFEVLVSVSVGITSMYRVLVLVVLRDLSESWLVCTLYLVSTNMTNFGRLAYVRLVHLFQPQEPQLHGCQFDFDIPPRTYSLSCFLVLSIPYVLLPFPE